METLSAFVSCEAVGYIDRGELDRLRQLAYSALRSLNGDICYIKNQQQGQSEYGSQFVREVQPIYTTVPGLLADD
jgi:hypothetical protein